MAALSETPGARGPRAPAGWRQASGLLDAHPRVRRILLAVVPLIAVVLLWQLVTAVWLTQERLFPPPAAVWDEIRGILGNEGAVGGSYGNAAATLKRIVIAFALSFVAGSALGVLAGRKRLVFDLVSNPLWVAMAVPSVVWAFIFVVVFGTGDVVPIAALMALLIPNVLIAVAEGTKNLSKDLLQMADSFAAPWRQKLVDVYAPQLLPYLFGSARVAFSLAIKVAVIAEVIGVQKGIGYELDNWYTQTVLAPVVAWGILLTAFGLAVDTLVFAPLERRLGRWRTAGAEVNFAQEVV